MKLTLLLPGSGFPKLRSAVTLLESQGRRVLVDSGLCEDGDKLVAALALRGLTPEQVDTVVTTHLHYDHCGNHLLFPNARYLVSDSDYEDTRRFVAHYHADRTPSKTATAALLRKNNAAIKDFYVRAIVREITRNLPFYDALLAGDGRFQPVVLDKPLWLTGEIEIIATPGHTPGHLSVVAHNVEMDDTTRTVLIGGDAISSRNGELGDGEPHLAWSPGVYGTTRQSLLARFEWVIPGHDALMSTSCHPERESRDLGGWIARHVPVPRLTLGTTRNPGGIS
ncbi:MAG: MBL fold metallo-hydrolase [Thermoanaerobaculia bacterium]